MIADARQGDLPCPQEVPRAFDQEQTLVCLRSHGAHVLHELAEVCDSER